MLETEARTELNQSRLVAYYQEKLQTCEKELERLKRVEEECEYLREKFYNHYTKHCDK